MASKKFHFKLKDQEMGSEMSKVKVTAPPPVIDLFEFTDDDSNSEDACFLPTAKAKQFPLKEVQHNLPVATNRDEESKSLQKSSSESKSLHKSSDQDVTKSMSSMLKTGSTSTDAKESWKQLMSRMQTNQKNEVAAASGSRKRYLKQGSSSAGNPKEPKRAKLLITSDDSYTGPLARLPASKPKPVSVSNASSVLPSSDTKQLGGSSITTTNTINTTTAKPTLKPFPISSGFDKMQERSANGYPVRQLSTTFCSSFNHDHEDYSSVLGWNGSAVEVIELNDAPIENVKVGRVSKKTCPFYKKIPGTRFSVDAFSYGVIPDIDVYLLSHFHSDHYVGLTKNFCKTIICDAGTGNLVHLKLGVAERCIRRLDLNRIYSIQGTEVVLIAANHCPGSVMFILRLPNGSTVLHTGDFRYTPEMLLNPFLRSLTVDVLYLDTTYCDHKYDFPRQRDTISQAMSLVMDHVQREPQTLILCGAYCIGKERVFFSIAEALGTKVFCAPDKLQMLGALENEQYNSYLTSSETLAQVHVVPMRNLHLQFLSEYLAHRKGLYTHLIAVKPSGWEFASKGSAGQGFSSRTFHGDRIRVIGIPYSEHSSFSELEEFVRAIKPKKVQPTVGVGSDEKRQHMMSYISRWLYV